jgi:WD40 repeat protein
MTWRRVRWPAITCVVAGAVAAALLTWPSSSSASRPVSPFADRDGLVVFEQQPSGLLGTAAPDGSHPVLLTQVGALQGNDLPVASSDGRYLVNLEGQLITMGPAGPASISNLAEHESQAAVAQSAGSEWANASFADGSRYVVATQCQAKGITSQSWIAYLVPTGSGKGHAFGTVTSSAGDPESAGALVSAPASQSAASSAFYCYSQVTAPDKAIELLRPGQAPRTVITVAALSGALGYRPGTPVQLSVDPSPDGTRLAVVVVSAASRQQPGTGVAARPEMAVITRAGAIVAHMALPPATIDVQWSPDGHQIASCDASGKAPSSVAVWDVGQARRTIVLPGRHDIDCTQLLWSPDGSQLIYAAQTTEKGLTQADNLQRGWTVIDLRSGRVHDVTAPGQPAAWLPGTARTAGETR